MSMRRLVWVWWLALALPVWAAQPVHARHAMVVAVEQHATDAGAAVLEAGGNAVDAAVAVGFALAVTHPSAGNIGGGGFMLVRFADGRSTFLDFRERAPEKASRNMYLDASGKATNESVTGYRAAGVPGSCSASAIGWSSCNPSRVNSEVWTFPPCVDLCTSLTNRGKSCWPSPAPR